MAGVGFRQGLFFDESRRTGARTARAPWLGPHGTRRMRRLLQFLGRPEAPWFTVPAAAQGCPAGLVRATVSIVLLSHGTGGTTDGCGWRIALRRLASWLLASTTTVPRRWNLSARRVPCWWEGKDLSVLLTT